MATLNRALWTLSIFGATVGMYVMVQAFRNAQTEQEGANCATIAIACALVPHCLARAVTESSRKAHDAPIRHSGTPETGKSDPGWNA